MKELGTIEQEAQACRKAFADVEVGAPVWCCHHQMLFETLEEPAENRIRYILIEKDKSEQARRLREFRPMKAAPAYAEYDRVRAAAYAEYDRVGAPAYAEYDRVRAPAYAEYQRVRAAAYAEYDRVRAPASAEYQRVTAAASAEYQRVRAAAYAEMQALHLAEYPDTAWTGKSIFPEVEE